MRHIYEIDNDILACFDEETGEIINQRALVELMEEKHEKIDSIACYTKDLAYDIKDYAEEIKHLQERKKAAERTRTNLLCYLAYVLKGKKYHSARCAVSFRKTERIEVADDADVPQEYLKTTVTVDKAGLKQAVKNGATFPGVSIVEGQSVIVK